VLRGGTRPQRRETTAFRDKEFEDWGKNLKTRIEEGGVDHSGGRGLLGERKGRRGRVNDTEGRRGDA